MLYHGQHYNCATVMQMEKAQNGAILDLIALHGSKSPVGRILADVSLIEETGCWELVRRIAVDGYGQINIGGKIVKTHRVIYSSLVGEIPDGFVVRHKCDNRKCNNPAHLEAGTYQDNSSDMVERDRQRKGETHQTAKLSDDDALEIVRLVEAGATHQEIADRYDISRGYVSEVARGLKRKHLGIAADYSPTANKRRGSSSNFAKINEASVLEIRGMLANGAKQKEIAEKFGIDQTLVSQIKLRKIWAHLE